MDDVQTTDLSWLIGFVERFEDNWQRGRSPRIEAYLNEAETSKRPDLLRELLRVEREIRIGRGESPTAEEYERRFSEQATLVRDVFAHAAPSRPRPPIKDGGRSLADRNLLFGVLALHADLIDSK